MVDIVDQATRSRMMAGIKGKNTQPELLMRRGLHKLGFRFRLHFAGLPGHPDICLKKYNAVIFVHGCYWHRHPNCRFASTPKSRADFWQLKFSENVARDQQNQHLLKSAGYRVAIVWECALRGGRSNSTISEVANWLRSEEATLVLGECDETEQAN